MKTFSVPKQIVHGEDSLSFLSTLDGKKASIVTGGNSMKKFGFIEKATKYLEDAGMSVQLIDGVEPDPSVTTCINGGKLMSEFEPDWIIALGGGSALDASKIMWVYYEYPDYDFQELVNFKFPQLRTKARLICIPSTSGTASEITAFSVITDTDAKIKYPLVSPHIIPDVAILDHALPATMPASITAVTGMDVMAHALESYVSTASDDYTESYSLKAIQLVLEHLQVACENPDNMLAREKMHTASTIAGMAFSNASLGIVHSMAHKIGGEFHLTHGEANAILMPYIADYNRQGTNKYTRLEGLLGIDDIAQTIRNLNKTIGISPTIKDGKNTVISDKDFNNVLDRMSKNAFSDACTLTNPRKTSAADIKKIYAAAYYGNKVDF